MSLLLSANSTIGIITDVTLVVLVIIIAFAGLAKGFVSSLLSIIGTAIVLAIAVFTAKYVAQFLNGIIGVVDFFAKKITAMLNGMGEFFTVERAADTTGQSIAAEMPETLFEPLQRFIIKILNATTFAEGQTVGQVVGSALGAIITTIICGIAVFIILKLLFNFLARFFDNVSEKKPLGGMDKLLGLILGLVKGGVLILVLGCITSMLCLVPKINDAVTPVIQDNSTITKFAYNFADDFNDKYIIENLPDWLASLYQK